MEDLTQLEMRLGDKICHLIKQIYFESDTWQSSYRKIAVKFSLFKRIMRTFYPDIVEITDILSKVQGFIAKDVEDIFSFEDRVKEEVKVIQGAKYDKRVTWVPIGIERLELLEAIRQVTVNDAVIEVKKNIAV